MTAHVATGASGMERWEKCPGSIALLNRLSLPETEEEDYQVQGTCAHAGLASCFETGEDAWEVVCNGFDGVEFTIPMANAAQVMLDACRADYEDHGQRWVEKTMQDVELHPGVMGTVDHAYLSADGKTLTVSDFKYGEGVVVEVEENSQFLYYANMIRRLPDCHRVEFVKLRVVQPRAYHPDGPVREWSTTIEFVKQWEQETLLPALKRTEESGALLPGDHCRFCPAKLVCPAMRSLFAAVAGRDASEIATMDDATLDADYALLPAVMMYKKALDAEVFRRTLGGHTFKQSKLVNKKSDRVWKDGAKERFEAEFGDAVFVPRELRSPAQMEQIDPRAKTLVKEWAYTPNTGHTLAPIGDKRAAIKVQDAAEKYANMTQIKDAAE